LIVINLLSPAAAQRYHVQALDDEPAIGIRDSPPPLPPDCYLSKTMLTSDKGRFYAFGRVFSSTVCAGHKIRIRAPATSSAGRTTS
ncbi:hypothetical protein C8Q73DRAFT_654554, partial [Cubamyces lactineus]